MAKRKWKFEGTFDLDSEKGDLEVEELWVMGGEHWGMSPPPAPLPHLSLPFPENLTGCAAHLHSSVSLRSNRIVSSLRRIRICFGSFRFSVSSAYSQNTDKSDVHEKASSNYNNGRHLKLSKTNPASYPEGSSGCESNLKRGDWNAERVDFPLLIQSSATISEPAGSKWAMWTRNTKRNIWSKE